MKSCLTVPMTAALLLLLLLIFARSDTTHLRAHRHASATLVGDTRVCGCSTNKLCASVAHLCWRVSGARSPQRGPFRASGAEELCETVGRECACNVSVSAHMSSSRNTSPPCSSQSNLAIAI